MINQTNSEIKDSLFIKGVEYFNDKKYYDAHEVWEELWSDYSLKDALFIQGLIQVSVAYFHITNLNLKGANSLFNKSLPKLKKFGSTHRKFDVKAFILNIEKSRDYLSSIEKSEDFNWTYAPKIIFIS